MRTFPIPERKHLHFNRKGLSIPESSDRITTTHTLTKGFTDGTMVKNPPANAADTGIVGSIPGLGRSPAGRNGNHSSILAWKIPWLEEPGRLQPMGLQKESDTSELLGIYLDM